MLSNVGGIVAILFAILFHGHMEATDVGATAASMPGLRYRLHGRVLVLCTWLPLTGSHGGILKARWTIQPAPHRQSRKEDNDIGGAEKLGRLILIITMLRGKNFWLKMEKG